MEFYPTAGFSDAMKKMNTMDANIKSITLGLKLIGPAYTVKCYPGGIITCHKALGEVPEGYVLVVSGDGDPTGALWGELTSLEAMKKGVKGIVLDGAVRDVAEIRKLAFPTFAKHITPRVGSNRTVGTTGEAIVCGGVVVRNGDIIVGDDDGVIVIPKEEFDYINEKTKEIEEKERDIAIQIKVGAHIADLIGMSCAIEEADIERSKSKRHLTICKE